jgi:putative endonuclease
MEHIKLGQKGEKIAAEFLVYNGYRVLHKNWRYLKGELDLVVTDGTTLVVVEVKTRSSYYFGDPEESINHKKLKQIFDAADRYMEVYQVQMEIRYDIISIIFHGDSWTIDHIPDAFYPFMQ